MSGLTSVTTWLVRLKEGQRDEATRRLWETYFSRLVGRAHGLLKSRGLTGGDAEDVALSAFASFVNAVEHGRFPRLEDREDLWQVLLVLTARKAGKQRRREAAKRRGGGKVVAFSDLAGDDSRRPGPEVLGGEPDPAEAAALAETCSLLLDRLGKEDLRQVALWRLESYSNAEIAGRLGCHEGTVERKLQLIREIWQDQPGDRSRGETFAEEGQEPRPLGDRPRPPPRRNGRGH
jgi:DNA-directed RNA polymerase specialized sigma24 family protein